MEFPAAVAASLAGHTAFNLGEAAPARVWARVVEECGRQAQSPDLTGWGVRMVASYLGNVDRALDYLHVPARPRRKPRYKYFKTRSRADNVWRIHLADCCDGLRAKKRYPFPIGEGRSPRFLAAHPALRQGVVPCERCIGPCGARTPTPCGDLDVRPPGAAIGRHRHRGDNEYYVVTQGTGVMDVDGRRFQVASGDVVANQKLTERRDAAPVTTRVLWDNPR